MAGRLWGGVGEQLAFGAVGWASENEPSQRRLGLGLLTSVGKPIRRTDIRSPKRKKPPTAPKNASAAVSRHPNRPSHDGLLARYFPCPFAMDVWGGTPQPA